MSSELPLLLAGIAAAVTELQGCLAAEHAALGGGSAGQLDAATAAKNQALTRLEALEQRRRACCAALGADASPAAFGPLLDRLVPADGTLPVQWERVRRELRACQRLNQGNGQALAVLQRRARQALQLLRGGDGGALLYGPGGATLPAAARRERARA